MSINPLQFTDRFGFRHTEPSVTGLIEVETTESARSDLFNDLIVISPFRSGKPGELSQRMRQLSEVKARNDPDGNNDQGVRLVEIAKDGFSDLGVNGAADVFTLRVGQATNATASIKAGATPLLEIATVDYGSHTNNRTIKCEAGTVIGKKVTIQDPKRRLVGDNLGVLLSLQYTGNGSAATASVLHALGRLIYTGQPADEDKITINGTIFEFDDDTAVSPGNVQVTIGDDADETFANLVTAITTTVNNVAASLDTDSKTLTIEGLEEGVVLTETTDSTNKFSVQNIHPAARLRTVLTAATDGSLPLDIPLSLSGYDSIDRLVQFINLQQGYRAILNPYANKFLPSTGLDIVSGANIKASAVSLTGFNAAISDWVNTRTRGQYTATELVRDEPDEVSTPTPFTGGTTMAVVAADWEAAAVEVASKLQRGGILLVDTDDVSIMGMFTTFIEEQRSLGRWFRAFFGAAPALTPAQYLEIAASLDNTRVRLTCQRLGRLTSSGAVEYLHPVFFAAAMAGGCAGNRPYVNPLTNKRLRFVGIHEDDAFDMTTRDSLLEGGITVAKKEEARIVVSLAVTTSRDPDRRMPRIMSEIDCVDLIDANFREAFLQFRGKWATADIGARVIGVGSSVLNFFYSEGALVDGQDEYGKAVPPWRFLKPAFIYQAGILQIDFQIFIGGEVNHIDIHGRAQYQRIVGPLEGGTPINRSFVLQTQ